MTVDWIMLGGALFLQLLTLLGGVMIAWGGINRRISQLEGRIEILCRLYQSRMTPSDSDTVL